MRKSYSTEILILFFIAVAGAIMFINWIAFIGGLIIVFLTSYFLITKLKEQAIKEYLNAKQKIKNAKTR